MKRLMSVAIVAAMLSVSFAVGVSIGVQAGTDFVEFTNVPWTPLEFTPNDIAWDESGSVAVVVGTNSTGSGANVYVYDYKGDTWHSMVQPETYTQPMNGVCWDSVRGQFWMVGTWTSGETSSVYNWAPGAPNVNLLQDYPLTGTFLAVSTDNWGNPMVVGSYEDMNYLDVDTTIWNVIPEADTPQLPSHLLTSIDFNWNDFRFYAVGDGLGHAAMYYSDTTNAGPLNGAVNKVHIDMSSPLMAQQFFKAIEWNQADNYALVVGSAIFQLTPGPFWIEIKAEESIFDITNHLTQYMDISWDTDGYGEAAIVGQEWDIGSNYVSYYWRYLPDNGGLKTPIQISSSYVANCVDFKPPSSPKFPMIPLAGGGVIINVAMNNQDTKITANAVFPKVYWIGFNDTTTASRLDQQVPLDSWYNFTVCANYSEGWNSCEVIVQAWYDNGNTVTGSTYPAANDGNRDLAFSMIYTVGTGYSIIYPTGDLEVIVGAAATDTDTLDNLVNPTESRHIVEMPIYLGAQIRFANGGGFLGGDTQSSDPNVAFTDANSWDFNITVRDQFSPSAIAYSLGEFGIQETVSISATGNPAGNAPPGSGIVGLSNPSIISYSANTDYWVMVSIPHLYQDGDILSANWIDATDVYAWNVAANATGVTDLDGAYTPMAGSNIDSYIWGAAGIPIGAPSNGTNATGPDVTNFNAGAWLLPDYTQVDWAVDVQAATPEGIYWGTITITIDS